jgi:hypothetical protein
MIFDVKNPVQARQNFERRRSVAIGAQKEGFRSGVKESYTNQNIISIAPGAEIQKAIDAVYASGGGTVVLLTGTHVCETDITLYENVILQGETFSTVLDFNNTSHGIILSGTPITTTGTIAVTNGSSTVTGTSTAWGADIVGLSILIDGAWNTVFSVSSATSLLLDSPYSGPTQSGLSYVAAEVTASAKIERLTIVNSQSTAIYTSFSTALILRDVNVYDSTHSIRSYYTEYISSQNIVIAGCDWGYYFENTYSLLLIGFAIVDITNDGFTWTTGGDSTCEDFQIVNCAGNGMKLTDTTSVTFLSFTVSDNTGKGIEYVSGCNDIQFIGGKVNRNGSDGIKLTATSDRNAFIGITCDTNTGYGINIAAATDDNNMISSCALVSNTAGQINNAGTGTKARGIIGNIDIG